MPRGPELANDGPCFHNLGQNNYNLTGWIGLSVKFVQNVHLADLVSRFLNNLFVAKLSVEDIHFQQVVCDVFVVVDIEVGAQFILQLSQYASLKIRKPLSK